MYQVMVDAGVRAEVILNRLEEYEELEDDVDGGQTNGEEMLSTDAIANVQEDLQSKLERGDVTSSSYISSALSITNSRL